jgi:hypothetical protein
MQTVGKYGGKAAPLTPEESAHGMIKLIDSLKLEDTGGFLTSKGDSYPW